MSRFKLETIMVDTTQRLRAHSHGHRFIRYWALDDIIPVLNGLLVHSALNGSASSLKIISIEDLAK